LSAAPDAAKLQGMKGLWTQTLLWLTAMAVALLLAFLGPDAYSLHNFFMHDSIILNGSSSGSKH
jgi:hypothetical protein